MSPPMLAAPEPTVNNCPGFITRLLLRCGKGDESALADLFDLTFFPVSAIVSGSAGSSGIDDKVVEAFLRIWHRSPTFEPSDDKVLAWVFEQAADCG